MRTRTWHRVVEGVGVVAVTALVAACGDGGGSAPPSNDDDTPREAFPVEIEHRFGATTVEERPERIVTVGLTDHDALLALGIVPVGTTEWFGGHPGAVWPWAQDELGDAAVPELVGDAATINFEKIAALTPDLILAVYSGLTDSDYETLSEIAPTVAQPDEHVDYGVPWEEQTRAIGRAVGLADEADGVVAKVEAQFAAAREEHPSFEGAPGLVATPQESTVFVYSPQDARGRFMEGLGFVDVPEISDQAGASFGSDVSFERFDLLDVDALVWIVTTIEADVPQFEAEPLYAGLDVHTEARDVFVENLSELGGATSFVSVLSLPFLLDGLVPMLGAAIDGDPATAVPTA